MDSSPSIDSLFAASPVMGGKGKKNVGGLQPPSFSSRRRCHDKTPSSSLLADDDLSSSSPTAASLAADLSQNFHISNSASKSPSIPTPRRALFPSLSFQVGEEPRYNGNSKRLLESPLGGGAPASSSRRSSKFRRTQSMFENPQDVVMGDASPTQHTTNNNSKRTSLSPINDNNNTNVEEGGNSPNGCYFDSNESAPPFKTTTVDEDPFHRINSDTLCDIMDGKHSDVYSQHMLIDCRFEYEYEGGHINGAVNINSKDQLQNELLTNINNIENLDPSRKTVIIFHCEYSAHRGPRMAMHLRNLDRLLNVNRYPYLYYPDIFILSGGYSHFFNSYFARCYPQHYVEMNHQDYKATCEKELGKFKKNMSFYKFPPKPPRSSNLFISKQRLFV